MRLLLALALTLLEFSAPVRPAAAQSADRFVTPLGTGDCSQAAPCALAAALSTPALSSTIYLAAGVYTSGVDPVVLISDTSRIVGGWNGAPAGEVVLSADPAATVLDGQAARRVVRVITGTVELSNLTLRGGRSGATTASNPGYGAALMVEGGAVTLASAVVISNVSSAYGAGAAVYSAELVVTATTFADNRAQFGGGAVYVSVDSAARLSDCVFTRNDSSFGSAVGANGVMTLTHSRIASNTGSSAVSVTGARARSRLVNNVIVRNTGGAVTVYSSPSEVLHNTFDANNIAVSANFSAVLTLTNNIVVFSLGRAVEFYNLSTVSATNNLFFGNKANMITGTQAVLAFPRFAGAAVGDYRIVGGSPALDAAVDVGVTDDHAHKPRPVRAAPDIGAFEEDVDRNAGANIILPLVTRRR